MNKRWLAWILSFGLTPALAASDPSPADQLSALQTTSMLLEWQLKNAKLRQQLHDTQSTSAVPAGAADVVEDVDPGPQLLEISGIDGSLSARIRVQGSVHHVRVGSTLPGGWMVRFIAPGAVVLQQGQRQRTLNF